MKKNLLAAALLSMAATGAMAQSAFEGFYGQIATGYESNNASSLSGTVIDAPGGPNNTTNLSASSQTFGGAPLVIGLGYNFSVAPQWVVGIGADYSALSLTSSNYSYGFTGNGADPGAQVNGANLKTSNRFNVFVTPGYAIDKDKLVYLKAGYSSVQEQLQTPTTYSATGIPAHALGTKFSDNQSQTVSGYIIGLGYKQIITGGLYGFAEGNYMSYGKATFSQTGSNGVGNPTTALSTTSSLNSYQLLVGVGYKF